MSERLPIGTHILFREKESKISYFGKIVAYGSACTYLVKSPTFPMEAMNYYEVIPLADYEIISAFSDIQPRGKDE